MASPWSLRRRLLFLIFGALFVILPIISMIQYRVALETADLAFDHGLADDARALAARARRTPDGDLVVDLPRSAEDILRTDSEDKEIFAVFAPDGRLLAGDLDLIPDPPVSPSEPSLSNDVWHGMAVRKASFRYQIGENAISVAFAETNVKRDKASEQILLALIAPGLVLFGTTIVLVVIGLHYGLAPLDALGRRISARERTDLSRIPVGGVPIEVRPLILEINDLMDNISETHAAQSRFLADAAHQLRTPLAGLCTQLELAMDEIPPASRGRLGSARDAAERLNLLVGDFLTLARAAPDATDADRLEDIDLEGLLEEIASNWHPIAAQGDCDLGFEPEPAEMRGVQWQVQELLANLIENAIRYGGAGTTITVRCGRDVSTQRPFVEVEDDGPGIPEIERNQVFERFYRGARHTELAGSGLGLAIVQSVARRHGAELSLTDGAGGQGVRIRVTFPVPHPGQT